MSSRPRGKEGHFLVEEIHEMSECARVKVSVRVTESEENEVSRV